MKRLFLGLLLVVLSCVPVFGETVVGSGEKTASAMIATGSGAFHGIMFATNGTDAVTVSVYDNTAASGTKLVPTLVIPSSATSRAASLSIGPAVEFVTGLYVEITCSGTVGYVVYTSGR
jgi:hypothetical protein